MHPVPFVPLFSCITVGCALGYVLHRLLTPFWLSRHYASQGISGSPFVPLVGDLPTLSKMRRNLVPHERWWDYWDDIAARTGGVAYFFLGPNLRLRITDVEMIREILMGIDSARIWQKTPLMRNTMGRLLGQGLLLSEGEFHKAHRQIIAPAFHFHRLKSMLALMADGSRRAVTALLEAGRGDAVVDFHKEAASVTLWIVCFAALGCELPGLLPARADGVVSDAPVASPACTPTDAAAVYESISFLMTAFVEAVSSLIAFLPRAAQNGIPAWVSPIKRRIDEEISRLRVLVSALLSAQRSARRLSARDAGREGRVPSPPSLLVDFLLDSTLSEEQILDEALTFVLAGHETTSQALSFAMLLLAQAHDTRAALRREVVGVLGGREPTTEDFKQMPLLDAVLKETMRLFPPAPQVARIATEDVNIPRAGRADLSIRSGTTVIIAIASVHRDVGIWGPDANEFKPERFMGTGTAAVNDSRRNALAWLPFSAGTRNCVGQNFAILEAKTILAEIVSRCDWRADESYVHVPEMAVTLRPGKGMPLRIWPVDEKLG